VQASRDRSSPGDVSVFDCDAQAEMIDPFTSLADRRTDGRLAQIMRKVAGTVEAVPYDMLAQLGRSYNATLIVSQAAGLRRNTFRCGRRRGEGSTPVPLPPPFPRFCSPSYDFYDRVLPTLALRIWRGS
jgi:hypothetical protein